jgi:hypothetical protein
VSKKTGGGGENNYLFQHSIGIENSGGVLGILHAGVRDIYDRYNGENGRISDLLVLLDWGIPISYHHIAASIEPGFGVNKRGEWESEYLA